MANKFKPGDRVQLARLEEADFGTYLFIGDIGVVAGYAEDELCKVKFDKPFTSHNANYNKDDGTYLLFDNQLDYMTENTVTIPIQEYKQFCKEQAKMQVLLAVLESKKYIDVDDVSILLGLESEGK